MLVGLCCLFVLAVLGGFRYVTRRFWSYPCVDYGRGGASFPSLVHVDKRVPLRVWFSCILVVRCSFVLGGFSYVTFYTAPVHCSRAGGPGDRAMALSSDLCIGSHTRRGDVGLAACVVRSRACLTMHGKRLSSTSFSVSCVR